MIHAYYEDYLYRSQKNLAMAFDIALRHKNLDPTEFSRIFAGSKEAQQFERGSPFVLIGMSGAELLCRILDDYDPREYDPHIEFGREYWAGYVLAYIQWDCNRSFSKIFEVLPLERILELYHPYHEMDIKQFRDYARELIITGSFIRERRERLGITQEDLAENTGISLQTIRAYEQGKLDIGNAKAESVYLLARVPGCTMEEILKNRC